MLSLQAAACFTWSEVLMVMGGHGLEASCSFCDNDCKSCTDFQDSNRLQELALAL